MRYKILLVSIISVIAAMTGQSAAQTIGCNAFYAVHEGDTLQKIAERAYGRGSAYQILYSANREHVGRNPGIIQIGTNLWIPCLAGPRPGDPESLPAIRPSSTGVTQVKLLTGSDFAPFTDQALENGGMITELVKRALQAADPDLEYKIDFINDWSAHLKPLLSSGAYDMGFPWYKPDCTQREKLGGESQWRCDNLNFSAPFYESVVAYFGLRTARNRFSSPKDMFGKTLCRPSGYFKFDLEVRELVSPNITLLQPHSVNECFSKLLDGDVDVVSINVQTADAAIKQLALFGRVVEYQDLATIETLHVVVPKTHPRSRSLLLRVNRGLKALSQSGTYRQVVTRHLRQFMN